MSEGSGGLGKVITTVVVLGLLGGAYFSTTLQEDEPVVVAQAPTPEPAPVVETVNVEPVSSADLAPLCIRSIQNRLGDLASTAGTTGTWGAHQSDVTRIVQMAINCDEATFEMIGDLDALDLDGADLTVQWSSSDRQLTLETIAVGATAPVAGADETVVVLR